MKGNGLHSAYSLYKRYRSKYVTWFVTGRHYTAPIDPFELFEVDPGAIRVYQQNSSRIQEYGYSISEVRDGDWDEQIDEFREFDYYRSFADHFEDNVPWRQTEWVQRVFDEMKAGIEIRNCSTREEFLDHCSEIDELYDRIRTEGYKTQRELLRETPENKFNRRWAYFCPNLHEITINIGRNGAFIFEDGWRRFAIADLLDVPTVPVRINVRHTRWQTRRDAIAERQADIDADLRHPDLVGLQQRSDAESGLERRSGHFT
jgi:hypothetical protein